MKNESDVSSVRKPVMEDRPPVAGRGWMLAAILLSAFGVGISLGLATPLVSVFLEARGYGSGVIGLTASAYATATLALAPFVPVLAKTFSLQVHDISMALVPCLVGTGIPHWVPGCPEKKRMIVIDR